MSHVNSTVKEIPLATFAYGLSGKYLIVTGFGCPEWTKEDVRLPETAVRSGYNNGVIAIVNSNKSCEEAWQRSVEANKNDQSIPVQHRLNPENYTKTDDERAAGLLKLPPVDAVIVHNAAGSWQVMAALYEAVEKEHPGSNNLAYRVKASYTMSRGEQMAHQLRIPTFSDPIDDSRTPVPQNDLPEIPEFQFSQYCTIYVLSR